MNKPRIKHIGILETYCGEFDFTGWWVCHGEKEYGIGESPEEAYSHMIDKINKTPSLLSRVFSFIKGGGGSNI